VKVCLVNPNTAQQGGDPHTGIPFMPFPLAYLAGHLERLAHQICVVDALGDAIHQIHSFGETKIRGLLPDQAVNQVPHDIDVLVFYARSAESFQPLQAIATRTRERFPRVPHIVIENSQAVTSFSLRWVFDKLLDIFDYVVTGESEERMQYLLNYLEGKTDEFEGNGIGRKKGGDVIYEPPLLTSFDLDNAALPNWDHFPLENYWNLGFSHGPKGGRFLPILSSRGCPYPCKFCVVPDMTARRWRGASPQRIVQEFRYLKDRYNIQELHFEDVNPTIRKDRFQELARLLIKEGPDLNWKLVSGTKIETLDELTISLMAKAGCTYISFSPESGSSRVLKDMEKPFDHELAIRLTQCMKDARVSSQACFVLGYPGEEISDRVKTERYIRKLTKNGLSEIALFIMTPVPGSAVYLEKHAEMNVPHDVSQLTFSPTWRDDYRLLDNFRKKTYAKFFVWKILYQPLTLFAHLWCLCNRKFNTKMEMVAYRIIIEMLEVVRCRLDRSIK